MRASHARTAIALGGTLAVLACATPVEVTVHPGADFSSYRTWDWLPGEAMVIHAPGADGEGAELRLAHRMGEELSRRGFVRVRESPDLRVGVVLAIRSALRVVQRVGAMQSVYTYHNSAAFEVQAGEQSVERFDHLRLEVYVSDARRGRVVWQARLDDRVQGPGVERLGESVAALLEQMPRPQLLAGGSPGSPAPDLAARR